MKPSKTIKQFAHDMRITPTDTEKILWEQLRKKQLLGERCIRQKPIPLEREDTGNTRYIIVDFYYPKYKYIIEVDGGIHKTQDIKSLDSYKEDILLTRGYSILRIPNEDIIHNISGVLEYIAASLLGFQRGEFKGGFIEKFEKRGNSRVSCRGKNGLFDKDSRVSGERGENKKFIMRNESFICQNCQKQVSKHPSGSARNHCPYCLYSLHLDQNSPGDRLSECQGIMPPVGKDYHKNKGWMVVHECNTCHKKIPNKLAEDDSIEVFSEL